MASGSACGRALGHGAAGSYTCTRPGDASDRGQARARGPPNSSPLFGVGSQESRSIYRYLERGRVFSNASLWESLNRRKGQIKSHGREALDTVCNAVQYFGRSPVIKAA